MEISVDKMINQKNLRIKQEKQNEKNKCSMEKRRFKIKRTVPMNKPPPNFQSPINIECLKKDQEMEELDNQEEIKEIKTKFRDGIKTIMAMPAKDKSNNLKDKIDNSKFMNNYIEKNTKLNMLDWMNEHLVFAGLYFNYYNESMNGK